MNLLNILPIGLRNKYISDVNSARIDKPAGRYFSNRILLSFIFSIIVAAFAIFFKANSIIYFILSFIFSQAFFFFNLSIKAANMKKKMENIFPDLIQLMSSNLRAGMTIDRAFMLSSRPEFAPLDKEVLKAGRDISTGKDIIYSFKNMAERIGSEKINKTIYLIISGLKSGGNISELLEQTASNMREKEFIEKRAASNILTYVIFIFFAVGIGAPVLFGLSSILVEIMIELIGKLPINQQVSLSVPFSFKAIGVSSAFVIYFSIIFMIVSDFISSMVIGLVLKGDSKSGLKYFFPLASLSVLIFFLMRLFLGRFLAGVFSAI